MNLTHLFLKLLLGIIIVTTLSSCKNDLGNNSSISITPENAEINETAKQIIVRIDGQNPGSGFIISRYRDTYYVLTAKHVVATPDEYDIITPDGKIYKLNPEDYEQKVQPLSKVDLSIVQFTSNENYEIPEIGQSPYLEETTEVYVAGFPNSKQKKEALLFTEGQVVSNDFAAEPLKDGYGIIYTNPTLPGMSGGPVFNEEGHIVAIHGRAELSCEEGNCEKTGFNLGIPINTFFDNKTDDLALRINTETRLENSSQYFSDFVNKTIQTERKSCNKNTYTSYQSIELVSAHTQLSLSFESTAKTNRNPSYYDPKECVSLQDSLNDKTEFSVSSTSSTKLILNNNGLLNFKTLKGLKEPFGSLIYPISFSPDYRYLIILNHFYYGRGTETDIGITIIDIQNNYQVLEKKLCAGEYFWPSSYLGFTSNNQLAIICGQGLGGPYSLDKINLSTFKIDSTPLDSLSTPRAEENYKSYGLIRGNYTFYNK